MQYNSVNDYFWFHAFLCNINVIITNFHTFFFSHFHILHSHNVQDFLDLAEPDIGSSHVRPYIPLGGRPAGGVGLGGAGGRRPHHGGAGLGGAGVGGHVPYVPTHTAGHHVPVHAYPSHSAPSYHGPGSYGGGGHGGGGYPYHHTPVDLGDDTYLSPHR